MKQIEMNGYKRIDKRQALKQYTQGKTVYVVPQGLIPSLDTIIKLKRVTTSNMVREEFEQNLKQILSNRVAKGFKGTVLYFYELSHTNATKYKLSADLGVKVRLINIMTGQSVDVEKTKVIERMQLGMVEILGYSVSPDKKDIIQYR